MHHKKRCLPQAYPGKQTVSHLQMQYARFIYMNEYIHTMLLVVVVCEPVTCWLPGSRASGSITKAPPVT